jgi:hypothetical protein
LKNTQISNFMKIRPVGAELFHAGGHDKTNSGFPQFCTKVFKKMFERKVLK